MRFERKFPPKMTLTLSLFQRVTFRLDLGKISPKLNIKTHIQHLDIFKNETNSTFSQL